MVPTSPPAEPCPAVTEDRPLTVQSEIVIFPAPRYPARAPALPAPEITEIPAASTFTPSRVRVLSLPFSTKKHPRIPPAEPALEVSLLPFPLATLEFCISMLQLPVGETLPIRPPTAPVFSLSDFKPLFSREILPSTEHALILTVPFPTYPIRPPRLEPPVTAPVGEVMVILERETASFSSALTEPMRKPSLPFPMLFLSLGEDRVRSLTVKFSLASSSLSAFAILEKSPAFRLEMVLESAVPLLVPMARLEIPCPLPSKEERV